MTCTTLCRNALIYLKSGQKKIVKDINITQQMYVSNIMEFSASSTLHNFTKRHIFLYF